MATPSRLLRQLRRNPRKRSLTLQQLQAQRRNHTKTVLRVLIRQTLLTCQSCDADTGTFIVWTRIIWLARTLTATHPNYFSDSFPCSLTSRLLTPLIECAESINTCAFITYLCSFSNSDTTKLHKHFKDYMYINLSVPDPPIASRVCLIPLCHMVDWVSTGWLQHPIHQLICNT